ncbi:DUF1540 domain-containing protein [Paenibacillus sp. P96]|uniref:DUF1540 domain-containing protein n=1 Tax=Paenibacillus zeirhizosphaerae TaxID=2987519 RepID=A0ABT9FQH4_9BACL|nr:DUF1540 domain-containing protein [Paenibacillus sp. P96]MDP4096966.1 DUF1540 domain-containing protein [Paenibacillus sp. P96]
MSQQSKPAVRCSVSNCHYWDQNNICKADVIMIDIDRHAGRELHEEYAGETFSTSERDYAETSAATCCHTFTPKKTK